MTFQKIQLKTEFCTFILTLVLAGMSGQTVTRIGLVDISSENQSQYTLRLTSEGSEKDEVIIYWEQVQKEEQYQIHQKDMMNTSLDVLIVRQSEPGIWGIVSPLSKGVLEVYSPFRTAAISGSNHILTSATLRFMNKLEVNWDEQKMTSLSYTLSVMEIIRNFTKTLKWQSMAIIYDDVAAQMVEDLIVALNRDGIFVSAYREQRGHNVDKGQKTLLDQIYESFNEKGVNITVICEADCVQRVLHTANTFDHMEKNKFQTAMRQRSRWLIITSTKDLNTDIEAYCYDLDNVAVLNLDPCRGEQHVDELSLLDVDALQALATSETNYSTSGVNITVPRKDYIKVMETFVEEVNSIPLCLWCTLHTLIWTSNGGKMRTLEHSRNKRQFQEIGYVNITSGIAIYGDIFPNVHFGFNGREFLTTTNWWPPFMDRYDVNGTFVYFGFCQDLLEELAIQLNFTYIMTEPADLEWGRVLDNGSWTGMIGELQREEVDMMIAPASIQAGREMVMDFTHPYYFDTSTILMKKPDPYKTKWRTLIEPFSDVVHICLWIALILSALILAILERINPFYESQHNKDNHGTFQSAFWYMFGAMLTQGGDRLPESQTGRTFISFWWLFSIVMVATYSGNLIAFLTVAKDKLPFNSLEEMVQQNDYQWGTLGGTYFITMFKDSKLPVYLKVWDGVLKANASDPRALSPDPAIHIQKILEEDYVYFGDKVVMDMRRVNDCRLTTADEEIPNMSYGVGFPNHSPYTRIFSNKILELLESGIFSIFEHRHWPRVNYCRDIPQAIAMKIGLVDVQSAFFLIGIGIVLGTLVLGIEFIMRYRYKVFQHCIPVKTKTRHCNNKHLRKQGPVSHGTCLEGTKDPG